MQLIIFVLLWKLIRKLLSFRVFLQFYKAKWVYWNVAVCKSASLCKFTKKQKKNIVARLPVVRWDGVIPFADKAICISLCTKQNKDAHTPARQDFFIIALHFLADICW